MAWIAGRVVDETGVPKAGVDVVTGERQHTVTDADGRFRFDGLVDGHHRLSATCGFRSVHQFVPTNRDFELKLRMPELTMLTVLGDDGPIANARVEHSYWLTLRTDEAGQTPARRLGMFRVSAAGYVPEWAPPKLGPEYSMKLSRGSMMGGVVLDPLDQPVPDARVFIGRSSVAGVRTDADGRWRARVAAGDFKISARGVLDVEADPIDVRHDGMTELDGIVVRTQWSATLTITVVDSSGARVPGARVSLSRRSEPQWGSTNGRGECTMRLLVPGVYSVCATTDREASNVIGIELDADRYELTLVVERDRVIAGRAVDADGAPIRDLNVMCSNHMLSSAVTDEEGRFCLGGVEPPDMGDTHWVHVHAPTHQGTATAKPGDTDVTIVATPR